MEFLIQSAVLAFLMIIFVFTFEYIYIGFILFLILCLISEVLRAILINKEDK